MGIPLLYPWANRLAGFDYAVAGRTVTVPHDTTRVSLENHGLPIHGLIGGRLAWEPIDVPVPGEEPTRAPAPGAQALAARLSWGDLRPELFEVFPFRHELHYEARLATGRLEISVTVTACGEDTVPVAFGFHPYFALPGVPREQWLIELPAMRRLALDAHQIPTGPDRALPAQAFELAAHEFDDGFDAVAQPARFTVAAGGRRIAVELLEGYPCAQVFAPPARQFVCFEPMTAPANALRSGAGLRLLAPGASHRARFAVSVEED